MGKLLVLTSRLLDFKKSFTLFYNSSVFAYSIDIEQIQYII